MKVILRVDITGTRNGEEWPARGKVVDLPADEAADMIAGGLAVAADEKAAKAAPESATVEAPENAATPKPRGRKATGLTTKNAP